MISESLTTSFSSTLFFSWQAFMANSIESLSSELSGKASGSWLRAA
jgi:hypothetical protein